MRRQPHARRPRIGLPARAAGWFVAVALLVQCAVGAGAALDMWIDMHGTGGMAQAHCAAHGKQDQHSGQPSRDHERCLLCNTATGNCPAPVLPLLAGAIERSVVLAAAPESVACRKLVYANAARGPPARA